MIAVVTEKEKTMCKISLPLLVVAVVLSMAMSHKVLAQKSYSPTSSLYPEESESTVKVRALLNHLASVQRFLPQDKDIINPSGQSSNYVFVRPLLREIYLEGKDALPALVEFFDNKNYLYSESGVLSMGPGQVAQVQLSSAAREIFEAIINPIPDGMSYESKIPSRIGADGREHRSPGFSLYSDRESAQRWLQQNADKSLEEIQRTIVDFYIREEIKIGFPDEESYQRYLMPLLGLRTRLPHRNDFFHNIFGLPYSSPKTETSKGQAANGFRFPDEIP